MGRNDYGQGWQQDKGGRGSRWQRKGKGDGKEKPNQTRFPRYDAKKVEPKEATPQKDTLALETSAPSDGSLVSTFQAHINAVRKAEARVQSLTQLRKQRTTQWDTYEANLQKSYMQEKERYQRAIQKLDSDLLEAEATQERMSTVLRQAHAASALSGRGTDADMPDTAESDAEALMRILGRDVRQWGTKLAAMEGAGPPPGLAMGAMGPENVTAPAVDSTNVGVATAPVPTGTAQAAPPDMPARGDVTMASPNARPQPSTPRTSVKAHTPPQFGRPDRPTLVNKLDARRSAMIVEGKGPLLEDQAAHPKANSVLVEDDDEDLIAAADAAEALSAMS